MPTDFTAVGSQSVLAVEAKQVRGGRPYETYLVRGLDSSFLSHTTFGLGDIARAMGRRKRSGPPFASGRGSPSWTARSSRAATTGTSVCFRTSGYPVSTSRRLRSHPIQVLDKQTGNSVRLTVIGILKDTAPLEMVGISTSERRSSQLSRAASSRRSTTSGSLPERIPRTWRQSSRRPSSQADWKPSRSSRWSTTPSPRVSPSTG